MSCGSDFLRFVARNHGAHAHGVCIIRGGVRGEELWRATRRLQLPQRSGGVENGERLGGSGVHRRILPALPVR